MQYDGLENIIKEFLGPGAQVAAASFGVAGPVIGGTAVAINLPWKITERSLKTHFRINIVTLINDRPVSSQGQAELDKFLFNDASATYTSSICWTILLRFRRCPAVPECPEMPLKAPRNLEKILEPRL